MKLVDLKQKFLRVRVVLHTVVGVAIGGGCAALTAHFTDPAEFSLNPAGIAKLKSIFIGGAAIAVFHLFQTPPQKGA